MPTEAKMTSVLLARALLIAALASMALQTAGGQGDSKATASAKTMDARPGNAAAPAAPDTPDVAKTLKAAAEAVGLARWRCGAGALPTVRPSRINQANRGQHSRPSITPPLATIRPPCGWK